MGLEEDSSRFPVRFFSAPRSQEAEGRSLHHTLDAQSSQQVSVQSPLEKLEVFPQPLTLSPSLLSSQPLTLGLCVFCIAIEVQRGPLCPGMVGQWLRVCAVQSSISSRHRSASIGWRSEPSSQGWQSISNLSASTTGTANS